MMNKIQILQHKLVMCRHHRSIDDKTAKWLRETLCILQASLKKELPEAVKKSAPFFSILEIAIQNMESYNLEGNPKALYFEAEHVHNIPEILEAFFARDLQEETSFLDYYLRFARKIYKENGDPKYADRFQNDWNTLQSFM